MRFDAKLSAPNKQVGHNEMMTLTELASINKHQPKKFSLRIKQVDSFFEIHVLLHTSKDYQVLVTADHNPKRWKSLDTIFKFISENCQNYDSFDILLENNAKIKVSEH